MLTRGLQATVETTGLATVCTVWTSGFCASVELTPLRRSSTPPSSVPRVRTARSSKTRTPPNLARNAGDLRRGQADGDRMDDVEVWLGLGAYAANVRAAGRGDALCTIYVVLASVCAVAMAVQANAAKRPGRNRDVRSNLFIVFLVLSDARIETRRASRRRWSGQHRPRGFL